MAESYDITFLHITTAIKVEAASGAKNIDVTSTTGMAAAEAISIVLDNDSVHWDIITGITDADTLVIKGGIPTGRHAHVAAVVKTYYAYMLHQKGETKDWLVTEAPLLPQTLITGNASPDNISPEREIQISQVDWRKGFQDLILDDEYKYYASQNCDARFKGQVILSGKKLDAMSLSGACPRAIEDAGMEEWDDANTLTYWTKTGDGLLAQSTDKHGGTYAARLKAASGETEEIYQDFPFSAADRSVEFTLKAWCKKDADLDEAKIGIEDKDGSVTWTAVTETNYTQKTCTKTLAADATRLRIRFYATEAGGAQYFYVDDVTCTRAAELGTCAKMGQFGSTIIGASGKSLFKIASGAITHLAGFADTITDFCVFETRLYIALGWSKAFWYTADLSQFVESTLDNNTAKHMSNVGGGQFWITDTKNTMRVSDNPINGGTPFTATPYTVGSADYEITGLVDHAEIVFCRKQDQVYYLSEADVLPLLPKIACEASTTLSYKLYRWGDCLYIPAGVNSLYEYDISTGIATTISPVRYAPGDSGFMEEVTAICADETYFYLAIDYDTAIIILAGRWETVEGDTDWFWHPLYEKTSNDITAMFISSADAGNKRLYAGTDTSGDGIYPFIMSVSYSDVLYEDGYLFEASGNFYTPWLTGNFPTEKKYWKSVNITYRLFSNTTLTTYCQQKGDGSWGTELGTLSYVSAGEKMVTYNLNKSSERVRFRFVLATGGSFTPILYGLGGGYAVFANLQETHKNQIKATIQLSPTFRERNGSVVARTMATDKTNLRALYDANGAMTVTGPDDTEYSVLFARDGYDEQLAYDETGRLENWWVTVRLLEV